MRPRKRFATETAHKVRKYFNINTPHVDVSELCKLAGIQIEWTAHVCGACEAISQAYKGGYCIWLPAERRYRRRVKFSLCHEFGHIVLKHFDDYDLSPIHAFTIGDKLIRTLDRETNIFTTELLMPHDFVLENYHKGLDYLLEVLRVSREAMIYRLDDLGILSLAEVAAITQMFITEKRS